MTLLLVLVLSLFANGAVIQSESEDQVTLFHTSYDIFTIECNSSGTIESTGFPTPLSADDFCVYGVSLSATSCNDTVIVLQLERENFHLNHLENHFQVFDVVLSKPSTSETIHELVMDASPGRCNFGFTSDAFTAMEPVICGDELPGGGDAFNFTSTSNKISFVLKAPHPGAFFQIKYWAMETSSEAIVTNTISTASSCLSPHTPTDSSTALPTTKPHTDNNHSPSSAVLFLPIVPLSLVSFVFLTM